MQRLSSHSKIYVAAALFACAATCAFGTKEHGKKGKSVGGVDPEIELISMDGEILVDKIVTSMASCGGADWKAAVSNAEEILAECNFKGKFRRKRRSAEDLYQIACSLTCWLKKMQFISEEGKFVTDDEKLKQALKLTKAFKDDKKLKEAARELALCSKLIPPFNEKNCYSGTAWSMCGVIGIRRVCVE